MVPAGQYVARGSAPGWPYGCRAGAARGLRPGQPTPPLSRICDGVGGSRRHVRVPAGGPPASVRCTTWRPCAVREPGLVRGGQRASGLGDHAGRMAGSSRPVTEQAGKAGAVWPLRDDEGRLSAIAGIEIWPSRGSLIRHAPRCSGNMGSGWGGGRLGSAPRPADCDERRARSGSGPCVEHDCPPLTLCDSPNTCSSSPSGC